MDHELTWAELVEEIASWQSPNIGGAKEMIGKFEMDAAEDFIEWLEEMDSGVLRFPHEWTEFVNHLKETLADDTEPEYRVPGDLRPSDLTDYPD